MTVVAGMTPLTLAAADQVTPDILFNRLEFSDDDKRALGKGEIVSSNPERTRDDQLRAAVALPVKASLAEIAAHLLDGSNIPFDVTTLAWGNIKNGAQDDFENVKFASDNRDEVEDLLEVEADSTFNFSSDEIAFLQDKLKGLDRKDPASAEAAAAAYREVLAGRFKAYAEKGLDGVAAYDHGGDPLQPRDELLSTQAQAEDFLSRYFPDFWKALSNFPDDQHPDVSSKFYWVNREVEGRPAFILLHQMVQASDDFVLVSQRQFYVGHDYEALQMFALALPFKDRTVIFSVNNVYTHQITGFFSGVAESVGGERTRESMTEHFEQVRKRVE